MIKRILVRCPSTSKLTPTGQTVDEESWERDEAEGAESGVPALPGHPRLDEEGRRPRALTVQKRTPSGRIVDKTPPRQARLPNVIASKVGNALWRL